MADITLVKISALPAAEQIGAEDLLPVVQEGATKAVAYGVIKDDIANELAPDATLSEAGKAADAKAVGDALALKADKTELTAEVNRIDAALNTKVNNSTYTAEVERIDGDIATKADAAATTAALATKANANDVTEALALKADKTEVNAGLALKADKTELTAGLATKQDALTFDTTPTDGSTNPVTSGGVFAEDANLKNVLVDYNSINLTDFMDRPGKTGSGLVWTWGGDQVTVSGTATNDTYINLFYSNNSFPKGITPGGTYYIRYSAENVRLRVYRFNEGGSTTVIANAIADDTFTVLDTAVGLIVRLFVASGTAVNETVKPIILDAMSAKEISGYVDILNGNIDNTVMHRGTLPNSPETDLDNIALPGAYFITGLSNVSGTKPSEGITGNARILVIKANTTSLASALQILSANARVFVRAHSSAAAGVWGSWVELKTVLIDSTLTYADQAANAKVTGDNLRNAMVHRGTIDGSVDVNIDTMTTPGMFFIDNLASASGVLPDGIGSKGRLFNFKSNSESLGSVMQILVSNSNIWMRAHGAVSGIWAQWIKVSQNTAHSTSYIAENISGISILPNFTDVFSDETVDGVAIRTDPDAFHAYIKSTLVDTSDGYITQHQMGDDGHGHMMYYYATHPSATVYNGRRESVSPIYPPDGTTISPYRVIVSSNIHHRERNGNYAMYNILKNMLTARTSPQLRFLYDRVEFIWMPCCCPTSATVEGYENIDGINVNRAFPLTQDGTCLCQEATNMKAVIDEFAPGADLYLDAHTFGSNEYYATWVFTDGELLGTRGAITAQAVLQAYRDKYPTVTEFDKIGGSFVNIDGTCTRYAQLVYGLDAGTIEARNLNSELVATGRASQTSGIALDYDLILKTICACLE